MVNINSHLSLSTFNEKNLTQAYEKFKEGLYNVSQAAFGWDENFQHDRFMKAYRPEWFHHLEADNKKVGYVCFSERDNDLHVHLLIIYKEFQGLGFGKSAMECVSKIARTSGLDITLSTLKNNTQAVELYKKLGYIITHQDEYFLEMILKSENNK